ncbi:MAG: sialate O-acetylesterase [Clostridiales bacterium]|jgi:sialate O-acetylesterase|nr:sialate O-acetylesterase [Clostridiales bacterium]
MLLLNPIFQDSMVLQRGKPIILAGVSSAAQKLSVLIAGREVVQGIEVFNDFAITIPPQEAMFDTELEISGTVDKISFKNVDIGEVWIAGGQSNMEYSFRKDEDYEKASEANDRHIRYFEVWKYAFDGEEKDGFKDSSGWGRWMDLRKENSADFSAVGVYFALKAKESLNVPIGVIGCSWGGTTASAWLDRAHLEEVPQLRPYTDEYNENLKKLKSLDKYIDLDFKGRKLLASPLAKKFDLGQKLSLIEKLQFVLAMPAMLRSSRTMGPRNTNRPCGLFETMVSKAQGCTARGVIWYQGESDDNKADIYHFLFSAVIKCWRDGFKDESLQFLFVQLAPFGKWYGISGKNYPILRREQEWVSKNVPGAYMASIMDSGDALDIHPKRKRPVGERLALLALGKVYGKDILCDPPEFKGGTVSSGQVRLEFANAPGGLVLKGEKLNALEALVDGKPVEHEAVIDNEAIVLKSKAFTDSSSIEARFAWTGYCEVNLYNASNLSAKPFLWKNR